MNKKEKVKKQPLFAAKFFRRITASVILLLICFLLKSFAPDIYSKVHSNLTYTPDLTQLTDMAKEFILKYTP